MRFVLLLMSCLAVACSDPTQPKSDVEPRDFAHPFFAKDGKTVLVTHSFTSGKREVIITKAGVAYGITCRTE
jgi:hypothetical protein